METLNLITPTNGSIGYDLYSFPDGQHQVVIKKTLHLSGLKNFEVTITSRLKNWIDLEILICSVTSLRRCFGKSLKIHVFITYFLGARSDRSFSENENTYLRDVICPPINALNLESITVFAPHSYVLENCLNNYRKEDDEITFLSYLKTLSNINPDFKLGLVAVDKGCVERILSLVRHINFDNLSGIIYCDKKRNGSSVESSITKIECDIESTTNFVMVDDICDGGGTFIVCSSELQKIIRKPIHLLVTHGIFSNGLTLNGIDNIFCSNSYKDIEDSKGFKQFKIF